VSESSAARRVLSLDNRYLAPLLITCILAAGQLTFGFLESYDRTALAILTAIAAEIVLGKTFTGRIPHLASAYITGISVGILVRSPEVWPYALCSLISITSKYLIRMDGRHLWNPSNLGICALLFLAPDTVASLSIQWGNNLLPMLIVWLLGFVIVHRLGRVHITLSYVVCFVLFAFARSLVTGHAFLAEVSPITGPMYQLFIFFMITDPKTTVSTRRGQVLVAVLVAAMEATLRLLEVIHAPYYALFLVGPLANAVEILWTRRKGTRAAESRAAA
jgi:enediyne biosynthesis protein E5